MINEKLKKTLDFILNLNPRDKKDRDKGIALYKKISTSDKIKSKNKKLLLSALSKVGINKHYTSELITDKKLMESFGSTLI